MSHQELQALYKEQILKETPSRDEQRIQLAYKLLGFRENNRAKQILSEVHGGLKSQASYLLSIIAQLEKKNDAVARHLEEAAAAPEYRLLLHTYRKEEIDSDIAEVMARELSRKRMSTYASLCECYRTLPLPSKDSCEKLLEALSEEESNALEGTLVYDERSIRNEKNVELSEESEELEKKRREAEMSREKKRTKKHLQSSGSKSAAKKEVSSGVAKFLFAGLMLCRFGLAYILPFFFLIKALLNAANDTNCSGANKLVILLPLIIWIITMFVVKFKVLKQYNDNHVRVTGAWWLFYLPTTLVLIYRTFLSRQEALTSAGSCFFTALVTCLLLTPQLVFLWPCIKKTQNREDFCTAALCGIVCFVVIPILCLYFTDASMDNFWAGITAAVKTN